MGLIGCLLQALSSVLSFQHSFVMSSSLRRMIPRVTTQGQKYSLSYRLPQRFFRGQYVRPRSLRPEATLCLNFQSSLSGRQLRNLSTNTPISTKPQGHVEPVLPVCCPGCGAYSQTVEPNEPGYYGKTRKQTRKLLGEAQNEASEEPARQEVVMMINKVLEESETVPKPRCE
jgi:hypothetical protein